MKVLLSERSFEHGEREFEQTAQCELCVIAGNNDSSLSLPYTTVPFFFSLLDQTVLHI